MRKATETMNESEEENTMIEELNYNKLYELSDAQLGEAIRGFDFWDADLCRELVKRAGLEEEYDAADPDEDDIEQILYKAADKLGIEIL